VTDAASGFQGFVWLSDSRRSAYVDSATRTIWLLDVETGRRKALVTDLKLGSGLAISPDGRTLYASISREQADL
jgi:sugar lactone lactonase YvrE